MLAGLEGQFRRIGIAQERVIAVLRARSCHVVIKKALAPDAPAVGHICWNLRQHHFVQYFSRRIRQHQHLAAALFQLEGGVQFASVAQGRIAVAPDDLVLTRIDGRSLWKLPFSCASNIVGQPVAGQIDRLIGGIVDFHPVGVAAGGRLDRRIVGGHNFCYIHACWVEGAEDGIHPARSLLRIRQTGRRVLRDDEHAVFVARIGRILRHVIQRHAVNKPSAAVRQHHIIVLRAEAEVRVRHGVRVGVGGRIAVAVDQIVPVRLNRRAFREAPLKRLAFVVAQRVIIQRNHLIGRVVQFHPVADVAACIGVAGQRIRADLVDDDRAVRYQRRRTVFLMTARRVLVAGAVLVCCAPAAIRQARITLVHPQNRGFHRVDEVSVRVIDVQFLAIGGNGKLCVHRLSRNRLIFLVAQHNHAFACRQLHIREQELNRRALVGKTDVLEVDGVVGAVPDFQPVGVISVLIRHRGSIRRHNLAENQSLIITQRTACGMHQIILRPRGIIRLLHRLFRADDDHNCHQRNQHGADEDIQHTAFLLTIFHSGRHLLRLCATLPFFGLIRLHGNPFCGQEDIHPRRGAGRSGGFSPSVSLSTNRTMQHRPILHCITKTYSRASIMTILRGFFIFWSQFG